MRDPHRQLIEQTSRRWRGGEGAVKLICALARALEADDALLLAFVMDRAPHFFLGDLRRRRDEGVVELRELKSSLAVRVKIEQV